MSYLIAELMNWMIDEYLTHCFYSFVMRNIFTMSNDLVIFYLQNNGNILKCIFVLWSDAALCGTQDNRRGCRRAPCAVTSLWTARGARENTGAFCGQPV